MRDKPSAACRRRSSDGNVGLRAIFFDLNRGLIYSRTVWSLMMLFLSSNGQNWRMRWVDEPGDVFCTWPAVLNCSNESKGSRAVLNINLSKFFSACWDRRCCRHLGSPCPCFRAYPNNLVGYSPEFAACPALKPLDSQLSLSAPQCLSAIPNFAAPSNWNPFN
jgi:hypothetical protein